MTKIIDPRMARFAAAVNDAYEKVCNDFTDEHFWDDYAPIQIELRTINGLTARFWEEGIEFYPAETKEGEK